MTRTIRRCCVVFHEMSSTTEKMLIGLLNLTIRNQLRLCQWANLRRIPMCSLTSKVQTHQTRNIKSCISQPTDHEPIIDNQFIKNEKKIDIIFTPTQIKNYDNRQRNFVLSYVEAEKDGDLRIFYYGGLQSLE